MSKPLLLLDVDGVLCPFGGEPPEGFEQHMIEEEGGWVYINPANAERLKRLMQSFNLVWATMWEGLANTHLLEPHGLEDPLPVIEFGTFHEGMDDEVRMTVRGPYVYGGMPFKLPWIKRHVGDQPFAWIDDDIVEEGMKWAAERAETIPTLFVLTEYHVGLTDEHVEELEEWAAGVQ
jgi:hypothetical protein